MMLPPPVPTQKSKLNVSTRGAVQLSRALTKDSQVKDRSRRAVNLRELGLFTIPEGPLPPEESAQVQRDYNLWLREGDEAIASFLGIDRSLWLQEDEKAIGHMFGNVRPDESIPTFPAVTESLIQKLSIQNEKQHVAENMSKEWVVDSALHSVAPGSPQRPKRAVFKTRLSGSPKKPIELEAGLNVFLDV